MTQKTCGVPLPTQNYNKLHLQNYGSIIWLRKVVTNLIQLKSNPKGKVINLSTNST